MYTKTEFCKRAGVTPETLRHYVDIGLIRPKEVSENGYRKYDMENVLELWFYRLGMSLGNSLKELRTWNEAMSLHQFHQQLCERERNLQEQLEEVKSQLGMIREIRDYTEREMDRGPAVTCEQALDGYRVFSGEDAASVKRMAEVAELFPYASITIDYPLDAMLRRQGKPLAPRLSICVLKDQWHRLDLSTTQALELMPARESLCYSLLTSRPLSLEREAFAPLIEAWKATGRAADSDVICSVFCMEGGGHERHYLLKCRILLRPER